MKVLFVSWELDPFFKVGGLGDVARSLPAVLHKLGIDIRNVMPYYKAVKLGRRTKKKVAKFTLEYEDKKELVEVFQIINHPDKVPVYLLRNTHYLATTDSSDTFVFFNKAVCEMVAKDCFSFRPDIIHCNDHHTALIPLLVRYMKLGTKTLLTLHNLAYQGVSKEDILSKLGIKRNTRLKYEKSSGRFNFLAEGIVHADLINTVSPTYAKEITTDELGFGLGELLRGKAGKLTGILNGITIPWKDSRYIKKPNSNSWQTIKKKNKIFLQHKIGLPQKSRIPLFSFVGRFDVRQKGIHLIYELVKNFPPETYQLVVLGKGDINWEVKFRLLASLYPQNIYVRLSFDDVLAHEIYAASDFALIPSRYEPCGLVQMLAMNFGAVPIAHKTGGLKDTIKDGQNGFLFEGFTPATFANCIKGALTIYQKKNKFGKMVENALLSDFSWKKSAGEYLELYNRLIDNQL